MSLWVGVALLLLYDLHCRGMARHRTAELGAFLLFVVGAIGLGGVIDLNRSLLVAVIPLALALAQTADGWLRDGQRWVSRMRSRVR